jgi:hypothetical protein
LAAAGVQGAASQTIPALPSIRLGVRSAGPRGWSVAADVASGRGAGYWETIALAYAGYRLGLERGRIRGFIGLEVGAGVVTQHVDGGATAASATVVAAPWVGGAVRVSQRVQLTLESHVPLGWVRRDRADALALYPAGYLGLAFQP